MLERISIKDFQSLHDVDLSLGRFTVVIGDTSAGKSAFIRTLHALAFNIRGNSHVTHGKKVSVIRAELKDWVVELQAGANTYTVKHKLGHVKFDPFAKLNGSVPPKVQEILKLNQTNFSDQFDTPFLLKDSGAQVARVLGELTNVNTIFEAVQSGNKKRLALSGELKTRQADLDTAKRELEDFQDLPDHVGHVSRMEAHMDDVDRLTMQSKSLSSAVTDLENAQHDLDNTHEYPDVPNIDLVLELNDKRNRLGSLYLELSEAKYLLESSARYPDVPDLQEVLDLQERRNTLSELFEGLVDAMTDLTEAKMDWNEADSLEHYYDQTLHNLLVEAGTCPTCSLPVPR